MTRLDERLRRELERSGRPADPTGVYEHLIRRRERRRIVRRVEAGALALAVSVGSAVGIWTLIRAGGDIVAAPGSANEIAAVLSDDDRTSSLVLISAEDGSVRSLVAPGTPSSPINLGPLAWSPSGDTLALVYVGDPGRSDLDPPGIYTVPADGGGPSLLFGTERAAGDIWSIADIAWSPDGARIAFAVNGAFRVNIDGGIDAWGIEPSVYTVGADGSDLQRLPVDGQVLELAWSPDGSALAVTKSDLPGQDIHLVELETGTQTRLTNDGRSYGPAWSPDGRQIAFTSGGAQLRGLFVMDADGSGRRRLTYPDGGDLTPTWSPDGEWIAVSRSMWAPSGASGAIGPSGVAGALGASGPLGYGPLCQVVLVAADGSGERVLVDGPIDGACATDLAWRPSPTGDTTAEPSPNAATASPAPSPTPEPSQPALAIPTCSAQSLDGIDFLGDGTSGTAWTAVEPKQNGDCPEYAPDRYFLAVDHTGDGRPDSSIDLPFECYTDCAPFAAVDLDADGTDELIVARHFSIMDFYVFTVRPDAGGDLVIRPVLVAEPGHEPAGLTPGEPLRIDAGGDAGYASAIECKGFPSDPVIVWSWRFAPVDGGEPTQVHVTRLRMRHGAFHVIEAEDFTLPAGQPTNIPFQPDLGPQCGVDWI